LFSFYFGSFSSQWISITRRILIFLLYGWVPIQNPAVPFLGPFFFMSDFSVRESSTPHIESAQNFSDIKLKHSMYPKPIQNYSKRCRNMFLYVFEFFFIILVHLFLNVFEFFFHHFGSSGVDFEQFEILRFTVWASVKSSVWHLTGQNTKFSNCPKTIQNPKWLKTCFNIFLSVFGSVIWCHFGPFWGLLKIFDIFTVCLC